MATILVLMYHDVIVEGEKGDPIYAVFKKDFERQMRILSESGVACLTLAELLERRKSGTLPSRSVVVSFDDGHASVYHHAWLILQRFGFRADVFVTTEYVGRERYLEWKQITALAWAGFGIHSHSVHHRYLNDLSTAEMQAELMVSKKMLEEQTGQPILFYAPPGGRVVSDLEKLALRAGYEGICTSQTGINDLTRGHSVLKRVCVKRDTPIDVFRALIRGRRWTLNRIGWAQALRDLAKRALGNRRYDAWRAALIGIREKSIHG